MKKSFLLFIVAAFALVLAACGSGESAMYFASKN